MAIGNSDVESSMISEISLTPLVDVMFTVMIVFIVSMPLLTNIIPITLPKAAPTLPAQKISEVRVSISSDGDVFINQTSIPPASLEHELRKLKENKELRVEILADERVAYREVARAMAQIQRAGVSKFTFVILPDHVTQPAK